MAEDKTTKQDEEAKAPKSATVTNGEKTGNNPREGKVGEPVETSFDERTSAGAPWLKADGTQDNGARDLSEPEGARKESPREGNATTVEETDKAIKAGDINDGKQVVPGEDMHETPKNPVK